MQKLRTLIIALAVSSTLATGARADEKSYRAAIIEFFQIANMEVVMQKSVDAMLSAQVQANPQLAPHEAKMRQFLNKYMSWKSLQDDFIRIYQKAFTEDEFKQIVAFYKTPVGQKTLQELPKLMEQGAQLGAQRVQQHLPELRQMIEGGPAKSAPAKSPPPKH
jgi:hypothetical protein